jgi:3-oxoacyl-[acyl-carrier-protein] synthase II
MSAIWITGIGLITGLRRDRERSWKSIREGRSCAGFLEGPDWPGSADPWVGFPVLSVRPRPPGMAIGVLLDAYKQAEADAGIGPEPRFDPDRVACLIGWSKPSVAHARFSWRAPLKGRPTAWETFWPSGGARTIAQFRGFGGPCLAPVAACATGLVSVLQGAELVRSGACDVAVCGASDVSLDSFWLAAFRRMGVLAACPPDGDPSRALRPWDRHRSGFLVGEGAALFIVERAESAQARGVLPYAELAGGALGGDAHHLTDLDPDPANLAALIERALRDAGMAPADIDYINVHGTATRSNDPLECRAIRRAFGPHADSLSCSANKAQIGHLLGAAGAAELAITCLALRDGFVPPTLNLDDPDPACDLDGTPHVGKPRNIRAALKLSIGFGGHLAAVVIRKPDGPMREAMPHG